MNISVLVVDDDYDTLGSLADVLRCRRPDWDVHRVARHDDAVEMMALMPIDVLVADVSDSCRDTTHLLRRVSILHPHCVRLGLTSMSGALDEATVQERGVPSVYQCSAIDSPESFIGLIEQSCGLRSRLHDIGMQEIVSRIECVHCLPDYFQDLLVGLRTDDPSLDRVASMIEMHSEMSDWVLQLVNSQYFGLAFQVTCPKQATGLLGRNAIESLTLFAGALSRVDENRVAGFSVQASMQHAMEVALLSRSIMRVETHDHQCSDTAFQAGFMHDIGKLILAAHLPERFEEALSLAELTDQPVWRSETAVLGTTHAAIGAHLLGLWGIPNQVVEAVALHHQPSLTPGNSFSLLTAVHMANAFCGQERNSFEYRTEPRWDEDYLDAIGCLEKVSKWKTLTELVPAS